MHLYRLFVSLHVCLGCTSLGSGQDRSCTDKSYILSVLLVSLVSLASLGGPGSAHQSPPGTADAKKRAFRFSRDVKMK